MPTRLARRRRKKPQTSSAEADIAEPVAAVPTETTVDAEPTESTPARGDLVEVLFAAYDFTARNPRVRGHILWIWSDGRRVYAVTNDRYLSNAIYHALRALGRNRVRRWSQDGKWIVAYS